MSRVLHLLLLLLVVQTTTQLLSPCSTKCNSIISNADETQTGWHESATIRSTDTVITIDYKHFWMKGDEDLKFNYLRFRKGTHSDQPLIFTLNRDSGTIDVLGRISDRTSPITRLQATAGLSGDPLTVQIVPQYAYKNYRIFLGPAPDNLTHTLTFDYGGTWDLFAAANNLLHDTTDILIDNYATIVRFVTTCGDPRPVLCSSDYPGADIVWHPAYGSTVKLECTASGAPYLVATWTTGTWPWTSVEIRESTNWTGPDYVIRSSVVIPSFSVDHIGPWTCEITNKNTFLSRRGGSVYKTFNLSYSWPLTLTSEPDNYYTALRGDVSLTWEVQGWPIDPSQFNLSCSGSFHICSTLDWYTGPAPTVHLTLHLPNGTTTNSISCTLSYQSQILSAVEIRRIQTQEQLPHLQVLQGCQEEEVVQECYAEVECFTDLPRSIALILVGLVSGVVPVFLIIGCLLIWKKRYQIVQRSNNATV